MKTVLQKSTDSSKPAAKPFFGKSGKDGFFAKGESVPFFQPKLKVNQPGDQYEKEADAVADKVVENNFGKDSTAPNQTAAIPATTQISRLIQTQCSDCGDEELQRSEESGPEEEEQVQTKSDAAPTEVPDALESRLESTSGVGASLPDPVKNSMESGMGADFSGVRIHTGADAVQMSNDLNAQAFTHGNDIYFNEGKYQPENKEGQHLLAHELTHTVQQGGVGRKVQKSGEPGNPVSTAPGPVTATNLDSGTFLPDDATAQQIEANRRGADVPVRFGNVASGNLRMEKRRDTYRTHGGEYQSIPLHLPFLQPLVNAGLTPVLVVRIRENRVEGYVSIGTGRGTPTVSGFPNWLRQHPREFGWLGLNVQRIPAVVNQIDAGNIRLEINGITVRIGGFIDGQVSFGFVNQNVTFSGNATVNIPHCEPAPISIERAEDGSISAEGDLAVQIANFGGSLHARYENGAVNIRGAVRYDTEKLSGEVTLLVTDERTARNVARENLPPELINQSAMDAATGGESGTPPSGRRALAGWGEVDFRFTEWMTGRAMVIIDNEGHVTIQGEITPPAEIELFPQRDFVRNIFTFEIRTLYGVPLVGNVFLFANIGMDALAKLGPAKIYNIRVAGTFSTDPAVFNAFSLQASLNISAFAGLRLRAEGGVGVELLGHDIKAGIGVNALAGIRGYVEATPTIGYRENADPEAGREGEFYFNGHLEIAAQPFLGLGGDLFVELDAPWWSPLSDDRWTWPLGELEYPLPGEFGIGADLDYVLGSGEMPEITFGEVDFNSERFMTDLINDHVPPAQSADEEHQGTFTEAPSEETGSDAPQLTDTEGNPPEGQPATAHQEGQPATPPSPEVQRRFGEGMQTLGQLAEQSESEPLDRAAVEAALARIRTQYHFTRLSVQPQGQEWQVIAEMESLNNHNRALLIKGVISEDEMEGSGEEQAIEQVPDYHEEFKIGEENHKIENQEGSYELIMFSTPVELDQYPDEEVRNLYRIYLSEVDHASTPSAKKAAADRNLRLIISKIKKLGALNVPRTSAPGIGNVALHKNQQLSLRNAPYDVWFLESEHVIPRAIINLVFSAYALQGIPAGGADYRNMHTILIYKGAAELKTHGESADNSMINELRSALRAHLAYFLNSPQITPDEKITIADEIHELINDYFSALAIDSLSRTIEAVEIENQRNGEKRGPVGNPEPILPTESKIFEAYNKQKNDINTQLERQLNTLLELRKTEP